MTVQPAWGIKLSKYFLLPQRIILAIMGFLAIVCAYTMRVSLSVVITQLVVKKNRTENGGELDVCPADDFENVGSGGGEYEWSEQLQGFILASFYIGYIVTHIPGGMLAERFGGKWTLSLGILSTAIFTLLTPFVIKTWGSTGLIILRVLMGVGEGTTFPAVSVLLSHWVPKKERGKLGALVLGGGPAGSIVSNSLSGVLLASYDWPIVFYVFGGISVVWFLCFTLLCFSDPTTHPYVKPSEKEFLKKELGELGRKKLPPTPWRAILTNKPMISMIVAQIGHDWGYFIMVSDLPKYMADVMQFSIKSNGLYTSLPYALMWIVSLSSGAIGDWIISRSVMNITNTRKLMTAIGAFGPAIFMVAASYAGCDRVAVVAFFTLSMGCMGCYFAGMKLTPLDLSPNYSGTLMALTNGTAAIAGAVAPYLVGVMTPNATLIEWRTVFWVAFGVLSATAMLYMFWASGEVQDFNEPLHKDDVESEEKVKN